VVVSTRSYPTTDIYLRSFVYLPGPAPAAAPTFMRVQESMGAQYSFDLQISNGVLRSRASRTNTIALSNTSLPLDRITDLVDIPRRTLTRRKGEGRLLPEESDRLLSASRLFGLALALFDGDPAAAADWLTRPQTRLGGAIPIDLAKTGLGAREVEALVGRLEHGVFP